MKLCNKLWVVWVLLGLFAAPAFAIQYTFTDLPNPNAPPGSTYIYTGINDNGQVTGYFCSASGSCYFRLDEAHAFILSNGVYTTLNHPTLTTTSTWAADINDSGQVVGAYSDASGTHGFKYGGWTYDFINIIFYHGTYATLDPSGSIETWALGNNDAGQVTGAYSTGASYNSSVIQFGFIENEGVYSTHQPSSTTYYNESAGINDNGVLAGWYQDDTTGFTGYTYIPSSGAYTLLPGKGFSGSGLLVPQPEGINDSGQVLVYFGNSGDTWVWSGGVYSPIDHPNAKDLLSTWSKGINDRGQIVGNYTDANLVSHGFIATPVKATTTTTLSAAPPSPPLGVNVTLTATVTGDAPKGTVTFKDGTTTLGTGTLDSNGLATFSTSSLTLGDHPITAEYPGDNNNKASISAVLTVTVADSRTPSTTALAASSAAPAVGVTVKFTATVSGNTSPGKTPSGTVTFMDGATVLGTADLNTSRQATLSTAQLVLGAHTITAVYAGDANNKPSTSAPRTVTVSQAVSKTTLTASSTSPGMGTNLTLTARVAGSTVTGYKPSGTVTFKDGDATLGTVALNASQVATFVTASLDIGAHSLTATYEGDSNNTASNSPPITVTVVETTTRTTLIRSTSLPVIGSPVTFTATVTGNKTPGDEPTGLVTFLDGATSLGTAPLALNPTTGTLQAVYLANGLDLGLHVVRAVYAGDAHNLNSSSGSVTVTVLKASSTTGLSASSALPLLGSTVTLTATVTGNTASGRAPTGTVTFLDGATPIKPEGVVLDANRKANMVTSSLGVGLHTLTAVYEGDGNNTANTSASVMVRVK